nr:MAG TPA: hypothetical protein [Herelleviridae sp.]
MTQVWFFPGQESASSPVVTLVISWSDKSSESASSNSQRQQRTVLAALAALNEKPPDTEICVRGWRDRKEGGWRERERDRKGVRYCCLVGQCVHRNDLLLQQNSLQYCWPGWFIADHMAITGLTACALCAPLAPLAPPLFM